MSSLLSWFRSNCNQSKMENLTDDLLVEILGRVPFKSVVRCKSISKRFPALICRGDFIKQFIYRYHTLFRHINQEIQWSLILLSNIVSVWELKEGDDSDSTGWRLLHKTPLPPLHWADSVRPEHGPAEYPDFRVQVRAFHPYHADVVFFQHGHRVFSGNLED